MSITKTCLQIIKKNKSFTLHLIKIKIVLNSGYILGRKKNVEKDQI